MCIIPAHFAVGSSTYIEDVLYCNIETHCEFAMATLMCNIPAHYMGGHGTKIEDIRLPYLHIL